MGFVLNIAKKLSRNVLIYTPTNNVLRVLLFISYCILNNRLVFEDNIAFILGPEASVKKMSRWVHIFVMLSRST
jgi:hypothetical protein